MLRQMKKTTKNGSCCFHVNGDVGFEPNEGRSAVLENEAILKFCTAGTHEEVFKVIFFVRSVRM